MGILKVLVDSGEVVVATWLVYHPHNSQQGEIVYVCCRMTAEAKALLHVPYLDVLRNLTCESIGSPEMCFVLN